MVWTRDALHRAIQIPPDVKLVDCAHCRKLCVRRWYMSDPQVSMLVDTGYACVYARQFGGRPICTGCFEEMQ